MRPIRFRKSSFSVGGNCVSVLFVDHGVIIHDSKNPRKPGLFFSRKEWIAFLAGVRLGEFDF